MSHLWTAMLVLLVLAPSGMAHATATDKLKLSLDDVALSDSSGPTSLRAPVALAPGFHAVMPDFTDVFEAINIPKLKVDSQQPRLVLRGVLGEEINVSYQDPNIWYAGTLGLHWTPFRPIPLNLLARLPLHLCIGDIPLLTPTTAQVQFDLPMATFGGGRRPSPDAQLMLNFELPSRPQ